MTATPVPAVNFQAMWQAAVDAASKWFSSNQAGLVQQFAGAFSTWTADALNQFVALVSADSRAAVVAATAALTDEQFVAAQEAFEKKLAADQAARADLLANAKAFEVWLLASAKAAAMAILAAIAAAALAPFGL